MAQDSGFTVFNNSCDGTAGVKQVSVLCFDIRGGCLYYGQLSLILRNIIPILFLVATVLAGCQSPSMVHTQTDVATVAAPAPFRPMLITTLGTNTTPDGTWRIGVSEAGNSVDVSYKETGTPFTVWSTISVPGQTAHSQGWEAHIGWLVFIESASRVWVYDGDRHLCLVVDTPGSGSFYPAPRGFPCAVPAEVFSRLSESAKKVIQRHD